MNTSKPKKALRSLFSRTEPEHELTSEQKSTSHKVQISNESKPSSPIMTPEETESEQSEVYTEIKTFEVASTTKKMEEQNSAAKLRNEGKEEQSKTQSHIHKLTKEPEALHEQTNSPISTVNALETIEKQVDIDPGYCQHTVNEAGAYSFVKIQYNLDLFKAERTSWKEQDYISFISRIDQAQTDAFFLKGRLVAEVKEKFYQNNKRGWSMFCEETLNMNYTTANQYIRVSQEFDVTSHQRKDFGFEHFKALLPLTKEAREELLTHTPDKLSVKKLREAVAKKLQYSSLIPSKEKKQVSTKNIVETLQKLKTQLSYIKGANLNQEEQWQLYGAFQNLSNEMNTISHSFITTPENKIEPASANNTELLHN